MNLFLGLVAAVFLATSAMAAELPYKFQTVDIKAPGQDSAQAVAHMIDINDHGEILAAAPFADRWAAITIAATFRQGKPQIHSCNQLGDTVGISLSNQRRLIAGYCSTGTPGNLRTSGFIKFTTTGKLTFLNFPGAEGTIAQSISPDSRYVTGQFWEPIQPGGALSNRFHCFLWDRTTRVYQQIDFPEENTYVNCIAVNRYAQILGQYERVNEFNETLQQGYFIWDNGNVTIPLPEYDPLVGGDSFEGWDMNNSEQLLVLAHRSTGPKITFFRRWHSVRYQLACRLGLSRPWRDE